MRLVQSAPPATAPRPRARRRRGLAIVEMAFVLPLFLMFLFAIFEYARYLMMIQVVHNAARDAARWGVVRSTAPEATVFSPSGARLPFETPADPTRPMYQVPFIETRFYTQTAGVERNVTNLNIRVYVTDPTTLYTDPPLIQPKPFTTAWNQGNFSERLAVQVVGNYMLLTPGLAFWGSTNVNIVALMGLEG